MRRASWRGGPRAVESRSPRRRTPLARLIIAAGKRAGTTVEVKAQPLAVGRLASCELPIEEPQASRKHFEVVRRGGEAWLQDLGSRNGTYLNEERVEGEAKLEDGDRIRVGATVISFEAGPAALPPGTKLGPYEVTGVVERRKGVTVHEAKHSALNRTVLVDVLEPGDPQAARFLARAREGSAFDHPSILAIYDAGEHEGRAYRVREVLVEARDLEARLREGQLDPELAVRVARQIAQGLAYLHAKGAVHGRLTPRLVLVDEQGRAKLELAGHESRERLDPERKDARLQALSASPEEARGLEATQSSDVYALGCVLYRMLAGVSPWDGDFPAIVRGHASEDPAPSIAAHDPELAAPVGDVLAAMLSKRPVDRPTADRVADELDTLTTSSSDETVAPPPPPPRPRPRTAREVPAAKISASRKALPPPDDTGSGDTDDVGAPAAARRIRTSHDFDLARAVLLGLVFALLFFLSSEGTRLALRFLQR